MHHTVFILAFGFLAPWLMGAGALATSIPVVIHLLNKRKFRIVVWAAMEWLLAAQRRNARRLRFHRWLLLAIRCLALLFIAAGVAELMLQSTALGALMEDKRATVILWDDSYSMGYQQNAAGGAATAFEKSRRLISDYIKNMPQGESVMVIRASTGGSASASITKPIRDHQLVLSQQVEHVQLSDSATDLPAAFDRAGVVLKDLGPTTIGRELVLVTDFTNSSIHDPRRSAADSAIEGAAGDRLKKSATAAISQSTAFHLVNLGAPQQENMAVTDLHALRPIVVAEKSTDLQVEVFNASDRPALDVPVSFLVDGAPSASVKIPRIEPASFQTAAATIQVAAPGRHLVEAQLPDDLLPADNVRRLMLNVRKNISVLLVDGSPGDGGRTSWGSTYYLQTHYSPFVSGGIFAEKVVPELELPSTPLADVDVVVLSDTSNLAPETCQALQGFVARGGLLVIFPGMRTDANAFNHSLGDEGVNLLPATLGQLMNPGSGDGQGQTFDSEGFLKNPVMQVFAADYKAGKEVGLLTVQTTQYYKLVIPANGSTETILRYAEKQAGNSTPKGDAAVVMQRDVGLDKDQHKPGGTVILFASSADMTWNTWGAKPSFAPFLLELTYYGLGRGSLSAGAGLTLTAGSALNLPGTVAPSGPWKGPRDQHIHVTSDTRGGQVVLSSPPLPYAGLYAPETGDQRPVVAVNPEAREADVRRVQKEQMAAALGTDVKNVIDNPTELKWNAAGSGSGGSYGPLMILIALCLFMLESILALAFSTYR